jgi:hypothetical protein
MSYSAMVDPAIPSGGFNASGYESENARSGRNHLRETQPLRLGPDRTSENRGAR